MWRHIGHSPRNVVPALRFLETKGLEDTSSATAMSTYCLTAKRVCLYLARAAPQQSIDQLVYAISLRGLEVDYPPGAGDADRRISGDDSMDMGSLRGSDAGSIGAGSSLGRSNDHDDDDDDDDDGGLKLTAPDLAILLLAEAAAERRRGHQGSPPRPTARGGGDARGVAGAHGAGALSPAPREPHARPRG